MDIRIVYQKNWIEIFIDGDLVLQGRNLTAEELALAIEGEGLADVTIDRQDADEFMADDA